MIKKEIYIDLYNQLEPYLLYGPEGLPQRRESEKIEYLRDPIFLDFNGFQINKLPKNFHEFIKVETLHYSHKKEKTLSEEILKMSDLEFLYLRSNCLEVLPGEIKKLKKLKVLYLDNNNLKDLPQELEELNELYMLDCDSNKFSKIPEVLFKMKNLKILNLAGMSISDEEINKLKESIQECEIEMSSNEELKLPF